MSLLGCDGRCDKIGAVSQPSAPILAAELDPAERVACIEETAGEAFHHGYLTTIVADAVSSFAPHLHAAALESFAAKLGWVADSDTGLSWL